MPTSSEFFTLCQAQVALLTQGLGAAFSIVYLTEELAATADPQLIPIVAYPEAALNWGEEQIRSFLTQFRIGLQQRLLTSEAVSAAETVSSKQTVAEPQLSVNALDAQAYPVQPTDMLLPQQQIVLPLIYQERVMGLLVTARADRGWNDAEQAQIEHIAQTLTAGCVLEWRLRWLAQDLQQQQRLEERKTDLFDNLLHQSRNPLTAVRTFGKLLVKRLRHSDANHTVAESIVRESDRLQELLKQLDRAIDLDVRDLTPMLEAQPSEIVQAARSAPALQQAGTKQSDPDTKLLLGSAINLEPHLVTEVLQPLLDSAMAIAQERQLRLLSEVPLDLPPVLIDLRALREVLSNLLDNALKYTPAGGSIDVSVQRLSPTGLAVPFPSRQVIVIADTGPGIPAEDLQHLFERHYRGAQAKTEIPGTGLGLTIARDLVRQMQGEVQIFSPAATSDLVPARFSQFRSPTLANQAGTAAVIWLNET